MTKYEKFVIVSDAQVPFHDPRVIELASLAIGEINPDHIIYNGDMIDFWSISKHQPRRYELEKMVSLQEEIDRTISVSETLASRTKNSCTLHNIDGNHEDRLERFLGYGSQAALGSLRMLRSENVLRYKERGFRSYLPYGEGIWIAKDLFVTHGSYIGPNPGESVVKEMQALGASVIMGHTHRSANVRYRQGKNEYRGIENGCMCQLSSSYKAMTNWTHAFSIVKKYSETEWTSEVVNIHSNETEFYCHIGDNRISVPVTYDDGLSLPWRPDMARTYTVSQARDASGRFC